MKQFCICTFWRERERERERGRERERERDRETERQRDRETEREWGGGGQEKTEDPAPTTPPEPTRSLLDVAYPVRRLSLHVLVRRPVFVRINTVPLLVHWSLSRCLCQVQSGLVLLRMGCCASLLLVLPTCGACATVQALAQFLRVLCKKRTPAHILSP